AHRRRTLGRQRYRADDGRRLPEDVVLVADGIESRPAGGQANRTANRAGQWTLAGPGTAVPPVCGSGLLRLALGQDLEAAQRFVRPHPCRVRYNPRTPLPGLQSRPAGTPDPAPCFPPRISPSSSAPSPCSRTSRSSSSTATAMA